MSHYARGLTIEGAWGIQTPRRSPNVLLGTTDLIGFYHWTLAIRDLALVYHTPPPPHFFWRLTCTSKYVAPGTKDRPVEGAEAHQEVQQEGLNIQAQSTVLVRISGVLFNFCIGSTRGQYGSLVVYDTVQVQCSNFYFFLSCSALDNY